MSSLSLAVATPETYDQLKHIEHSKHNITVLYVGSSLLAPLKDAERELNRVHKLDLRVAAYNFGAPLSDTEWESVDEDLQKANVVFVIHVMDGENVFTFVRRTESVSTATQRGHRNQLHARVNASNADGQVECQSR